jgi:hypothetical protein
VNEYTRREEARWTFIASTVLVVCIAIAVFLIFTARGRLIPDPEAVASAKATAGRAKQSQQCAARARELEADVPIFRSAAKAAHLDAPDADPKKRPTRKNKDARPDGELGWKVAAVPLQSRIKQLATCREVTDGAVGRRPEAAAAWDALAAVVALAPAEGDAAAQLAAARTVQAFAAEHVEALVAATRDAEARLKADAEREAGRAETARVHEPLPKGLLPRETAIALGVALAIAGLLVSYLSVKAASERRMITLVPLRELAHTPQRGMQAAAILKLAAQHNGGEPGLVIGAALGGLAAAILFRVDSDMFVAGVMAGLLIGLCAQWLFRAALGISRWRARAAELGEIEKPTTPIVLVLSGVNAGLESQFLDFFDRLAPAEAAETVDRLATQAEERILAAAEAGPQGQYPQMPYQHPHPPPG